MTTKPNKALSIFAISVVNVIVSDKRCCRLGIWKEEWKNMFKSRTLKSRVKSENAFYYSLSNENEKIKPSTQTSEPTQRYVRVQKFLPYMQLMLLSLQ